MVKTKGKQQTQPLIKRCSFINFDDSGLSDCSAVRIKPRDYETDRFLKSGLIGLDPSFIFIIILFFFNYSIFYVYNMRQKKFVKIFNFIFFNKLKFKRHFQKARRDVSRRSYKNATIISLLRIRKNIKN